VLTRKLNCDQLLTRVSLGFLLSIYFLESRGKIGELRRSKKGREQSSFVCDQGKLHFLVLNTEFACTSAKLLELLSDCHDHQSLLSVGQNSESVFRPDIVPGNQTWL